MKVVGLTGGIASGKSTVSNLLKQQSFAIIDCDKIAHDVVKPGRWGWKRVRKEFGDEFLTSTGEIDREKLGKVVFKNVAMRRRLNRATHLPVAIEILKQLVWCWLTCRRVVIIDMPLLFETGTHKWTRPTVLVFTEPGTQVRRLIARDKLSVEDAVSRVNSQMKIEDKIPLADILINNEGTLQHLQEQVSALSASLRQGVGWRHWLLSPLAVAGGLLVFVGGMIVSKKKA